MVGILSIRRKNQNNQNHFYFLFSRGQSGNMNTSHPKVRNDFFLVCSQNKIQEYIFNYLDLHLGRIVFSCSRTQTTHSKRLLGYDLAGEHYTDSHVNWPHRRGQGRECIFCLRYRPIKLESKTQIFPRLNLYIVF